MGHKNAQYHGVTQSGLCVADVTWTRRHSSRAQIKLNGTTRIVFSREPKTVAQGCRQLLAEAEHEAEHGTHLLH